MRSLFNTFQKNTYITPPKHYSFIASDTEAYGAANYCQSGIFQLWYPPASGWYLITATGAAASHGNSGTTASYSNYRGGKGAKISGMFYCIASTPYWILPGRCGRVVENFTYTTSTDGSAGGSGGASWVFRQTSSLTNSNYCILKDTKYDSNNSFTASSSTYWECLLCAAGGSTNGDAGYSGGSSYRKDGTDAALKFYSPTNYKAFSTSTVSPTSSSSNSNVLSLNQIKTYDGQGSYYTRNSRYGYGGLGCGTSCDDASAKGGGWCLESGNAVASWSMGQNTIIEQAPDWTDGSVVILGLF